MKMRSPAGMLLFLVFLSLQACAPPNYPSLWKSRDAKLHKTFVDALRREFKGDFWQGIAEKRIGIVLVDITDLKRPRVAEFNGDDMLYAASLPKIASCSAPWSRSSAGSWNWMMNCGPP